MYGMSLQWNWTTFCSSYPNSVSSSGEFILWMSKLQDFGSCFHDIFHISSHAVLLVGLSYFVGVDYAKWKTSRADRRRFWNLERRSWYFRIFAVLAMLLTLTARGIINVSREESRKNMAISGYARDVVAVFAWMLLFIQTMLIILFRNSYSEKSTSQLLCFFMWFPTCVAFTFELWSGVGGIFQFIPEVFTDCCYIFFFCQCVIAFSFITILLNPKYGSSTGQAFQPDPESVPVFKPIATAYDQANFLSKMCFWWVNSLIRKGKYVRTFDDLYTLPKSLDLAGIGESFRQRVSCSTKVSKIWLVQVWFSTWGWHWIFIGFLLLLAVSTEYMTPLFLQKLIEFFETGSPNLSDGYGWATGLISASVLSSLLHIHYNFLKEKLSLCTMGVLMDTIYHKLFRVYSADIATSDMSGKVVNLIGTDCGQINSGILSLHELWSLPLQVGISLYLLHLQVGISFLAGLGVVFVLLILNQIMASWIVKFEEKKLEAADSRIKVVQEILSCIRVIKFHAWEKFFQRRACEAREGELHYLKIANYILSTECVLWGIVPVGMTIATFCLYAALGNKLTAAKVFTSVAVFRMMHVPLMMISWAIVALVDTWVSTKRVQSFLALPELLPLTFYDVKPQLSSQISIEHAAFSWQSSQEYDLELSPLLEDVSFHVRPNEFIGITGKIGSGKSVLLNAIIGELRKSSGSVMISQSILDGGFGYASQEPWIMQGTIRANVLFGAEEPNEEWYKIVLKSCVLDEDIQNLPNGDLTEIGERGVTLSGGQKSRLALARAVFQNKDIVIMDDPLAAIDPVVATQIYACCIKGLLKAKTRILVSHDMNFLRNCDRIIVLKDGKITADGTPDEVLLLPDLQVDDGGRRLHRKPSLKAARSKTNDEDEDEDTEKSEVAPLIGEEEMETGVVKLAVHLEYFRAPGWLCLITMMVFLVLNQGGVNASDMWLAHWISHDQNSTSESTAFFITVLGGIAGATVAFSIVWPFLLFSGALSASRIFHNRLLQSVLDGKIQFFDSTPSGRILNRFSSDISSIDQNVPILSLIFFAEIFGAVGTIIVLIYSLPWISVILGPACVIYYFVQKYYRHTSRELKRINATSLSPLYSLYNESIHGLATIRSMRRQNIFCDRFSALVSCNLRVQFAMIAAEQWLQICLGFIGWIIIGGILFIGFWTRAHSANFGLALSYSLSVLGAMISVVESFINYEKGMVNVERILQYIHDIEPELFEGPLMTSPSWPENGKIDIQGLRIRYRDDLPDVLEDVSLEIPAGEKIGIVGRTGAGKSSLMMAIFRMVEVSSGTISIDGIRICHINLRHLRSRLTIIPQTPCLFNASIRDNLDPLHGFEDHEVWHALEVCHLKPIVDKLGHGLNGSVGQNGRNLSAGEKQLVSLARAILSKSKVICFDEATANIDFATDLLVQQTIREHLSTSTILTIAHRVPSVLDCDRIIVMSSGKICEQGNPKDLIQQTDSRFFELSRHSQGFAASSE